MCVCVCVCCNFRYLKYLTILLWWESFRWERGISVSQKCCQNHQEWIQRKRGRSEVEIFYTDVLCAMSSSFHKNKERNKAFAFPDLMWNTCVAEVSLCVLFTRVPTFVQLWPLPFMVASFLPVVVSASLSTKLSFNFNLKISWVWFFPPCTSFPRTKRQAHGFWSRSFELCFQP